MSVVATDPSPAMIAVAREKARRFGLPRPDRVRVHADGRCRAVDSTASASTAYSRISGPSIACATCRRWRPISPACCTANGALVWVIMGRRVPWEWFWYLLRADRGRAFRRYRPDGIEWRGLKVHYPTPAEVSELLRFRFTVTRASPLGIALPPSYAAGWLNRSPRTLSAMTRLEALAQRSTALAVVVRPLHTRSPVIACSRLVEPCQ